MSELKNVQVGDHIKVMENYGRTFVLYKVERVTGTRAVCENASFMIASGMQIGTRSTGRWSTTKYGYLVKGDEVEELKKLLETKARISNAQLKIDRVRIDVHNLEAAEAFLAMSKAS